MKNSRIPGKFKLVRQYHEKPIFVVNVQKKCTLGKSEKNIQVVDDGNPLLSCDSPIVSTEHAQIFKEYEGVWKIQDLRSLKGTFLNRIKIASGQRRELRDGDIIGLGICGVGPYKDEEESQRVKKSKYYIFKFQICEGEGEVEKEGPRNRSSTESSKRSSSASIKHYGRREPESRPHEDMWTSSSSDDSSDGLSDENQVPAQYPTKNKKRRLSKDVKKPEKASKRKRESSSSEDNDAEISHRNSIKITSKKDMRTKAEIVMAARFGCTDFCIIANNIFQFNKNALLHIVPSFYEPLASIGKHNTQGENEIQNNNNEEEDNSHSRESMSNKSSPPESYIGSGERKIKVIYLDSDDEGYEVVYDKSETINKNDKNGDQQDAELSKRGVSSTKKVVDTTAENNKEHRSQKRRHSEDSQEAGSSFVPNGNLKAKSTISGGHDKPVITKVVDNVPHHKIRIPDDVQQDVNKPVTSSKETKCKSKDHSQCKRSNSSTNESPKASSSNSDGMSRIYMSNSTHTSPKSITILSNESKISGSNPIQDSKKSSLNSNERSKHSKENSNDNSKKSASSSKENSTRTKNNPSENSKKSVPNSNENLAPENFEANNESEPSTRKENSKDTSRSKHHRDKGQVKKSEKSKTVSEREHRGSERLVLQGDTMYKEICQWKVDWLTEQRNESDLDLTRWKLTSVSKHYQTGKEYQKVYYPLMMHELWAMVNEDLIKSKDRSGFHTDIKIDYCNLEKNCSLAPSTEDKSSTRGCWVDVRCHTFINDKDEFLKDRTLCVFKYFLKTINAKQEEIYQEKTTFAFVCCRSEDKEEFNDGKFDLIKYKHSFNLIFFIKSKDNWNLAQKQPGVVERISCISDKLKNFDTLITLPRNALCEKMLNPQKIDKPWSPSNTARYTSPVPHFNILNRKQKSIVHYTTDKIITEGVPEVMLIHGTPGTGKTKTITYIILHLLMAGEIKEPKILVCAPTDVALDEIVLRLHEILQSMNKKHRPQMIRFCEEDVPGILNMYSTPKCALKRQMARIIPDINDKDILPDSGDYEIKRSTKAMLKSAQIVCCTLCSLNSCATYYKDLNISRRFSCCIIDESTQATEIDSLSPLVFKFDKLILVGDQQQLKATVLSKKAKKNNCGKSLYRRLYDYYIKQSPTPVMELKDQYRCHGEILRWPSDYFYNGKLKLSPIWKRHNDKMQSPLEPYKFFNCVHDTPDTNREAVNEHEMNVTLDVLQLMWAEINYIKPSYSIGVIIPHDMYKKSLENKIRQKIPQLYSFVELGTIQMFQGREKDIILITCFRPEITKFVSGNELNVALTRARNSLTIIGDVDYLQTDYTWKCLIDDAKVRNLITSIPKGSKQKQIVNLLRPIIESRRNSEIPEKNY